ncbi:MAG: 4-alpha-glucanotransferase [Pirellulaceae bacterium]|nr:4-alpha-glucanotransferase [Pirellulaceae bacterium]
MSWSQELPPREPASHDPPAPTDSPAPAALLAGRASGLLLHPTSLPGPYGIGCLGREAYRFVDLLAAAGQSYWQILPLGPAGYGDSPYSAYCSAAGNPLLIDLEQLVEAGDLDADDLRHAPDLPQGQVDYERLKQWKLPLLAKAGERFLRTAGGPRGGQFETFCREQADWLDDYALFMAIRQHCHQQARSAGRDDQPWYIGWDADLVRHQPEALRRWRQRVRPQWEARRVWQFYFFQQWNAVHQYAGQRGVRLFGDMPIFVSDDSVDVWMAPQLFLLDDDRRPTFVAGVPPDYFSVTGQRWGNPLYDWQAMSDEGFAWWTARFRRLLAMVDVIRVDHFRGFESYWSIPASEPTAVRGEWLPAPGRELFESLRQSLGPLPIVAEDLGLITAEVEALRDQLGFPGMKVLQFGLEGIGPDNPHVPERHVENSVVYTGTHDNNTTVGWYESLATPDKLALGSYLKTPVTDPAWQLIRLAMQSPSRIAIVPVQDVLRLGSEARMNTPGTPAGNWRWRLRAGQLKKNLLAALQEATDDAGRLPAASGERRA